MEHVSADSCLLPGYPLQLELLDDLADAPSAGIYASMVIGLEPDVLHVDIPKVDGRPYELPVGTMLHVVSLMEDALYAFDATITGYEHDLPIAMCLTVPDGVLRSQRRETVRVPSSLAGRLTALELEMNVTLRDISAGGVSFYSPTPIKGMLDLHVNLAGNDGQDWIFMHLLVRRTIPVKGQFIIACSFSDMARKDEDRVVAYLFRRQRFLRNQGN